ncbi:MAG TPA: hypothetical protein VE439_01055, partial [Anaerolineae bacterium]|nr:hypothetical protein [Anaerolineae bacterium]
MYLVDASVILKWFLPDEEYAEKADKLYGSMRSGEVKLGTDCSAIHEVANVLHGKGNLAAQVITKSIARVFSDGLLLIVSE